MNGLLERLRDGLSYFSPGTLIILVLAVLSSAAVLVWPIPERRGLEMWTFSTRHAEMYYGQLATWNEQAELDPDREPAFLNAIDMSAIVRRTLSAFWAQTPVADLIEVERAQAPNFFSGPLENIGFVDLTDRLHAEGLYDQINPPSFSPWTTRGRIFGLPHDVHPVLLWYRADLAEEAGIDVDQIETWDDFVRIMSPLQKDLDGDGLIDRYLLNLWPTMPDQIMTLLLQAGGGTFDREGELIVDSHANAMVLAHVVSWSYGPERIAIEAPEFSPPGNVQRLEGKVISGVMPDWLSGAYPKDLAPLSGRMKLMPLPAWEPGGRRTSVWGGTMLAITKQTEDFEAAWALAKHLYLSRDLAEALYRSNHIISPVRKFWGEPFYDEPDPYYSGQAPGRLYIEQAPNVPWRTSSPFRTIAMVRINEAALELGRYARAQGVYDPESLIPEARRILAEKAELVRGEMQRNVFLRKEGQ